MENCVNFDIQLNTKTNCGALLAIENNHVEVIETIIKAFIGLKSELIGQWDCKAFFTYACKNGCLEIAETLITNWSKFNIDINAKDKNGWTAFHMASGHGHCDIGNSIFHH